MEYDSYVLRSAESTALRVLLLLTAVTSDLLRAEATFASHSQSGISRPKTIPTTPDADGSRQREGQPHLPSPAAAVPRRCLQVGA